jgi:hypothetical protein
VASGLGTPAAEPVGKFPLGSMGAVEVHGMNRVSLILRGAIAAGAVYGAAAVGAYMSNAKPRHGAAIALLTDSAITPNGAFAKSLGEGAVLKAAPPRIRK